MPKVVTRVVGFTEGEWEQIRLGAWALAERGRCAGTLILPGRAELYRLEPRRDGYELRLSSVEELLEVMRQEQAR